MVKIELGFKIQPGQVSNKKLFVVVDLKIVWLLLTDIN